MDEPIEIKRNALDAAEAVVSILCLFGVVIYLILMWRYIPDHIPGHYNAAGEIDRWADKSELIFLPIISWMLFGLVTLVERYPQVWNVSVRITPENRAQVYRLTKNIIAVSKMNVLMFFAAITVLSSLVITISLWMVLAFLVVLFGSIGYYFVRLMRLTRA